MAKKRKKTDFTEQRKRLQEIREYVEPERQRLRDERLAREKKAS